MEKPALDLFVHGTLMQGESNHEAFCAGLARLSVRPLDADRWEGSLLS